MGNDGSDDVAAWFATSPLAGPLDSPQPAVKVTVDFGACSRRGTLQSASHCHYLVLRIGRHEEILMTSLPPESAPEPFEEYGYGMVVADGMGDSGEAASRLAISSLVQLAIYFGKWNVRIDGSIAEEVVDRAERFYRGVDSTLLRATTNESHDLQTTLTAVYTAGTDLFFAHVGHSRVYMFRDGELVQLTRDHPFDPERPAGAVVIDIAHRIRDHRLTGVGALGGPGSGALNIDIERCGLLDGDVILLSTNGLTRVVDDASIGQALRSHEDPDEQCRAVMSLVDGAKGEDDATVVVAQYHIAT
jgi:serine/threonine protein phosphatase PrpC